MSTKKKSNFSGSAWLIQRITGAALVILLGLHFIIEHFIVGAANVTAEGTRERMTQGVLDGSQHILGITINIPAIVYQAIAILLLAFSVHHGMYGVYNILMEQDFSERTETALKYVFAVVSIALLVQGLLIFQAFTGVI